MRDIRGFSRYGGAGMKYLFKCKEHDEFEVEQSMQDEHVADCPACGWPAERVWTSTPHTWEPYSNPNHEERKGVE